MYAIIKLCGRQYRAVPGQYIDVDRLHHDEGEEITIDEVLMVSDGDNVTIGQPFVAGASVTATIEQQFRGEKLIVYKYRQRTSYRRKMGYRHSHTRLRINDVNA